MWGQVVVVSEPPDVKAVLTGELDIFRLDVHAKKIGMGAITATTSRRCAAGRSGGRKTDPDEQAEILSVLIREHVPNMTASRLI